MRIAVAFALVAGCSGTPTLPFSLATQPLATAFKPLGGDWTTIEQVSHSERAGLYEIPSVDGTIAVACRRTDGSVQVEELFATAAELASELYAPLVPWPQLDCTPPPSGPEVQITGTMVQGGQVAIGDFDEQYAPGESFAIPVTAGLHDLVAVGQAEVLIRHDESYEQPVAEVPVDFAAGLTLGSVDVQAPLGGGSVETTLSTVNGTKITLPPTYTAAATYVPPELLEPGDVQTIHVLEDIQSYGLAQAFVLPALVSPELITLGYPAGAAFGTDAVLVDFSAADVGESVSDYRVQYTSHDAALAATATAGWVSEHGKVVEFDPSFPEFRWPVLPGEPRHELAIMQRSATVVLEAELFTQ